MTDKAPEMDDDDAPIDAATIKTVRGKPSFHDDPKFQAAQAEYNKRKAAEKKPE